MRWRSVALYALALLILAGFYYYMDVYRQKEKEKAEIKAKKVFDFSIDKISSIRMVRSDGKVIKLVKEGSSWFIQEPVKAVAEEASVKGLLNVMANMEADRWIDAKSDEAKQYGLDKPVLVIEATGPGETYVLNVGSKNPAETHYYARAGKAGRIFLMSAGRWNVLNKDVYDLRQKDLVTFRNDEVKAIKVSWNQGSAVEVRKEGDRWLFPESSGVKVKAAKVENLIDQIRWLKARKFLEELGGGAGAEGALLSKYGLDNPKVGISILLTNNKEIRLALAEPKGGSQTELVAYSSDLASVVSIDRDILGELPKTFRDLEDRSLFAWQEETVGRIVWKKKDKTVEFLRSGEDKWKIAVNGGKPEELKESWQIRSIFWGLEDLEYEEELNPSPPPPDQFPQVLEFFDVGSAELSRWGWKELPQGEEKVVTLWILKGEKVEKAVSVKASLLQDIVDKLDNTAKNIKGH